MSFCIMSQTYSSLTVMWFTFSVRGQLAFSPLGSTETETQSWSQLQRQRRTWSGHSWVRSHLSPCIVLAGRNTVCVLYGYPCEYHCFPCYLNVTRGSDSGYGTSSFPSWWRAHSTFTHFCTPATMCISCAHCGLEKKCKAWRHIMCVRVCFFFFWLDHVSSICACHCLSLSREYVFPPELRQWFPLAMLLSIDIALLIMI